LTFHIRELTASRVLQNGYIAFHAHFYVTVTIILSGYLQLNSPQNLQFGFFQVWNGWNGTITYLQGSHNCN